MGDTTVKSYRDLLVWQKGIELAKKLYAATRKFPEEERFGLVSQIRRGGVSVPSNIAEGQARRTRKDFIRFLYVSKGSLAELDTQLILSHEFGYTQEREHGDLLERIDELQRMLFSLIDKLGGSK